MLRRKTGKWLVLSVQLFLFFGEELKVSTHLRDRRAFRRAARDTIDLPRAKSAMVPMVLDLMG